MFGASSRIRHALILTLVISAVFAAMTKSAVAATVTLDGQSVTPVVQRNGHLFIPFSAPMERLGAHVTWNNPTATANLNGQHVVTLTMGSSSALINGTTQPLSVAPETIGGTAFVPVEALSDICGANVAYSADRTTANVTGCHLAGLYSTTPAARRGGFPWWGWLLIALAILGALWAGARARGTKAPASQANVVRGTIDDYIPRLKSALSQMDNSHRASFVQNLSQTFNENRSAISDSLVASTRANFDAAASGASGPVLALVDQVSDHPSILQIAAQKFSALYPGELGSLTATVRTR